MQTQILFAFFIYFLVLLAIGLLSHRKQTSSADFIVGNRTLNFWLTALTAHASDMSAWLFMGFPAALFIKGVPGTWIAIGLILGMYMNWQYIAKRLRIETEKYNSYTLSTFFERRFQDKSGLIRILTALMSTVYLVIHLGSGLYAMGILFNSLFGMNFYIGITIATLVVMTYTFFGGFITVAWTDFAQGIFLLFVILFVAFTAYTNLPSWDVVTAAADSKNISMALIDDWDFYSLLAILFSVLSWGLGYYGQPHIVTKFMGIRSPQEVTKAKYLGMSWQILSLGAAALIGLIGLGYFPNGLENSELVFVEIVKQLFSPLVIGFIFCGVIAANMSTMDSQILVCASVLSEDFYKHFFKQQASAQNLLRASRICVIMTSLVSLGIAVIAYFSNFTILNMVLYAWSGLGSSFGPLMIMSLYDPKSNKYGAVAGIVAGGIIAGFWPLLNPYLFDIVVPSMIPGFFGGLAAIYFVSRWTGKQLILNEI